MAYASHTAAARSDVLARVLASVENLVARVARYRMYRQTVTELAGLTDRELADLGLHRSMIKRIAIQAVYENA